MSQSKALNKENTVPTDNEFIPERDFTFDLSQAREHLNSKDPISVILRGHLYIEHALNEMLNLNFGKPSLIDLASINFPARVALCAAIPIIDQRTANICRIVNRMRNGIAHNLSYSIPDDLVGQLLSELPKRRRKMEMEKIESEIIEKGQKLSNESIVARFIVGFIADMQVMHHRYKIFQMMRAAALENARRILKETDPARNLKNDIEQ